MARIEFSANQTHLPKHPSSRPRPPPPPSGRDETRNSVDYISELPIAIILHIFSFLTTKDAIKTSVLSKQWRSTWTANSHISFSMPICHNRRMFQSFIAFMDAVLFRCTATKVKSFLFVVPCLASFPFLQSRIDRWLRNAGRPTIDRWLHFAVEHNVEEVSMTLYNENIYELPQFFFRCTTLVSFQVIHCCFSMMGAVNWPSLKRLRIDDAELKDNAMMRVLSGCPVLEFFKLKGCSGLKHIKVKSRGLKELVIDSHRFYSGQGCFLKVSAPHLLKLRLLGSSYVGGEFKVDKVSSLVEAELNFKVRPEQAQDHGDLVKTLLQSLHHVTKLVMGRWCLQELSLTEARGPFLPSLECRHLTFHITADHAGAPGIAKILESSPHLEKLLLRMACTRTFWDVDRCNFDAEEFWDSAKRGIYRRPTHLENVQIVDLGADWPAWEPVLSLLEFLLESAPRLDKIEINSNNSEGTKAVEPWALLEVARTILSHPNRSPSLKVILSYPSQERPTFTSVLKCDFHIGPDVIFS